MYKSKDIIIITHEILGENVGMYIDILYFHRTITFKYSKNKKLCQVILLYYII